MFGSGLRLSLFFVWFKVLGYGLRWHFHTVSSLTCKTPMPPISTMVMHFFFFLLYSSSSSSHKMHLPSMLAAPHCYPLGAELTIARPCPPRTTTMLAAAQLRLPRPPRRLCGAPAPTTVAALALVESWAPSCPCTGHYCPAPRRHCWGSPPPSSASSLPGSPPPSYGTTPVAAHCCLASRYLCLTRRRAARAYVCVELMEEPTSGWGRCGFFSSARFEGIGPTRIWRGYSLLG